MIRSITCYSAGRLRIKLANRGIPFLVNPRYLNVIFEPIAGGFFLSKSEALSKEEVDQFVRSHKEVFILISILKQLMPYVRSGTTIRYTEFISVYEQKRDEKMNEKWHYLFAESDLKSSSEKFFERLGKEYIIEQIDRKDSDSYLVLNGIDYYLSLLESM